MPRGRRPSAAVPFIVVTLILDVLGMGIVIPVMPELVTELSGGDASAAAVHYGLLVSSFALMQLLFAPVLGSLSDRFGRRPIILLSLLGFGANYLLMAFAPTLTWLYVARLASGLFGASITTANAYIADVSTPETRAKNFGLVGAAFGIGFIVGPAAGGLLGQLAPRLPFLAAAAVVLLNWLYGLFVLPESLPLERRRQLTLRGASPLSGLALLRRYPLVLSLAASLFFFSLAQRGLESIWVLHTHYRYGWSQLENGLTLALFGVMAALVQGVLIRRVVPAVGERRAVLLGLGLAVLGHLGYAAASQGWMALGVIVVASLGGVAHPALMGLVSGAVSPSEQGGVQGALSSVISLTSIVAPLVVTQSFSAMTGEGAPIDLPAVPFLITTGFGLVGLALAARAFRRHPAAAAKDG